MPSNIGVDTAVSFMHYMNDLNVYSTPRCPLAPRRPAVPAQIETPASRSRRARTTGLGTVKMRPVTRLSAAPAPEKGETA